MRGPDRGWNVEFHYYFMLYVRDNRWAFLAEQVEAARGGKLHPWNSHYAKSERFVEAFCSRPGSECNYLLGVWKAIEKISWHSLWGGFVRLNCNSEACIEFLASTSTFALTRETFSANNANFIFHLSFIKNFQSELLEILIPALLACVIFHYHLNESDGGEGEGIHCRLHKSSLMIPVTRQSGLFTHIPPRVLRFHR